MTVTTHTPLPPLDVIDQTGETLRRMRFAAERDDDFRDEQLVADLTRGERRYRRKVASAKQWQAIVAAKQGPCRVCVNPQTNGHDFGRITFHHLVSRAHGGDDVADNIVPLHELCHMRVGHYDKLAVRNLLGSLTDAEYAYMIGKGGEDYPERVYGLKCERQV